MSFAELNVTICLNTKLKDNKKSLFIDNIINKVDNPSTVLGKNKVLTIQVENNKNGYNSIFQLIIETFGQFFPFKLSYLFNNTKTEIFNYNKYNDTINLVDYNSLDLINKSDLILELEYLDQKITVVRYYNSYNKINEDIKIDMTDFIITIFNANFIFIDENKLFKDRLFDNFPYIVKQNNKIIYSSYYPTDKHSYNYLLQNTPLKLIYYTDISVNLINEIYTSNALNINRPMYEMTIATFCWYIYIIDIAELQEFFKIILADELEKFNKKKGMDVDGIHEKDDTIDTKYIIEHSLMYKDDVIIELFNKFVILDEFDFNISNIHKKLKIFDYYTKEDDSKYIFNKLNDLNFMHSMILRNNDLVKYASYAIRSNFLAMNLFIKINKKCLKYVPFEHISEHKIKYTFKIGDNINLVKYISEDLEFKSKLESIKRDFIDKNEKLQKSINIKETDIYEKSGKIIEELRKDSSISLKDKLHVLSTKEEEEALKRILMREEEREKREDRELIIILAKEKKLQQLKTQAKIFGEAIIIEKSRRTSIQKTLIESVYRAERKLKSERLPEDLELLKIKNMVKIIEEKLVEEIIKASIKKVTMRTDTEKSLLKDIELYMKNKDGLTLEVILLLKGNKLASRYIHELKNKILRQLMSSVEEIIIEPTKITDDIKGLLKEKTESEKILEDTILLEAISIVDFLNKTYNDEVSKLEELNRQLSEEMNTTILTELSELIDQKLSQEKLILLYIIKKGKEFIKALSKEAGKKTEKEETLETLLNEAKNKNDNNKNIGDIILIVAKSVADKIKENIDKITAEIYDKSTGSIDGMPNRDDEQGMSDDEKRTNENERKRIDAGFNGEQEYLNMIPLTSGTSSVVRSTLGTEDAFLGLPIVTMGASTMEGVPAAAASSAAAAAEAAPRQTIRRSASDTVGTAEAAPRQTIRRSASDTVDTSEQDKARRKLLGSDMLERNKERDRIRAAEAEAAAEAAAAAATATAAVATAATATAAVATAATTEEEEEEEEV